MLFEVQGQSADLATRWIMKVLSLRYYMACLRSLALYIYAPRALLNLVLAAHQLPIPQFQGSNSAARQLPTPQFQTPQLRCVSFPIHPITPYTRTPLHTVSQEERYIPRTRSLPRWSAAS